MALNVKLKTFAESWLVTITMVATRVAAKASSLSRKVKILLVVIIVVSQMNQCEANASAYKEVVLGRQVRGWGTCNLCISMTKMVWLPIKWWKINYLCSYKQHA